MNKLKFCLGLEMCLGVECEGRNGGLVMLWKEDVDITILNYSKHYISLGVDSNFERVEIEMSDFDLDIFWGEIEFRFCFQNM